MRDTRIPPVSDPWYEDGDGLRPAKGISRGVLIGLAAWVLAGMTLGVALVLHGCAS